MPSNTAAFIPDLGKAMEIRSVPYPQPKEHELVVENRSISLNPCDFAMQTYGQAMFPKLKFPCLIGEDVAGEVAAVGPGVTEYKVGDRVAGFTLSGFQKYPVVLDHLVFKIPDSISYEEACVIPLGLTTAASCLFHKDYLALRIPSQKSHETTDQTVLIWGGSTSVGSNAIQLAVAAGYEVVATASPHNFAYVKGLGASQVFDYNSATIKEDLIAALKGKKVVGGMAIGGIVTPMAYEAVLESCAAVLRETEGRKFLVTLKPTKDLNLPGIEAKFSNSALMHEREFGYAIFRDFLAQALAAGFYKPSPKPEVVGQGLEDIQGGLDLLKAGVSAKKLVITL
ncbi:putative zinc-binding alcohol dehydrogenase domain-containing protein cipB [Xylariaceae sp. AK1471]|nr:putative zinc-binding alcohol dehydrogenase domain-containing protein cipB [Xylariaceae sp. AK1471]